MTLQYIFSFYDYLTASAVAVFIKKHLCSSDQLVGTLIVLTVMTTLLLMCPWPEMAEFFEVKEWDFGNMEINYFRIYILLIPAVHMVVAIAIEVSLL